MNFLSLCSGIEAASVAFEPLGWKAVGFAEIDPFASAVLAHRYKALGNSWAVLCARWIGERIDQAIAQKRQSA